MPRAAQSSPRRSSRIGPERAQSSRARRGVRAASLGALAAAALALSACAAPTAAPEAGTDGEVGADAVTVRNCGVEVTFDRAPQRIVSIKSTATEMLLALGVGDRIVGTAFADGPVPEELAADAPELPVISDQVPSEETVLGLEPDLVYAGWESNLTADGAGERDELAGFGVGTYVSPAACRSADVPQQLDFDEVFGEIEELAGILRVDPAELLDEQRAQLAAIEPVDGAPTALWYSSGTDAPYVGAGRGAPQLVMATAGLDNVFADVDESWTSTSWEAVIDADPDVIVLIDAAWNTAESKIERLESDPATRDLAAVRDAHYVILPFAASEAGVRTVAAAGTVVDRLHELGY